MREGWRCIHELSGSFPAQLNNTHQLIGDLLLSRYVIDLTALLLPSCVILLADLPLLCLLLDYPLRKIFLSTLRCVLILQIQNNIGVHARSFPSLCTEPLSRLAKSHRDS